MRLRNKPFRLDCSNNNGCDYPIKFFRRDNTIRIDTLPFLLCDKDTYREADPVFQLFPSIASPDSPFFGSFLCQSPSVYPCSLYNLNELILQCFQETYNWSGCHHLVNRPPTPIYPHSFIVFQAIAFSKKLNVLLRETGRPGPSPST